LKLEGLDQAYMSGVLKQLYANMYQNEVFLVPVLTGTNAEELSKLPKASGFPIQSITLGPLDIQYPSIRPENIK
jgi:hypothetical protein